MALKSIKQYTGDGNTTDYLFDLPYIKEDDIHGIVDSVEVPITFIDSTNIRFTTPPADQSEIEIRRLSDASAIRHLFPDNTYINSTKLDGNSIHQLYLHEETQDITDGSNLDAAISAGEANDAQAAAEAAAEAAENAQALAETATSTLPGMSVANKTELVTITPIAGQTVLVLSSDGGLFIAKTGAPVLTYSDDGGSYCGTVSIPTGGDGSSAWVRLDGGYNVGFGFNPAWYGAVAGADCTAAFNLTNAASLNIFVPFNTSAYILDGAALLAGTTIYGVGDDSILDMKASPSNTAIFKQSNVGDIEVHDLRFTNSPTTAGIYGLFFNLLADVGKENINVHHCSFDGFTVHNLAVNGYLPNNADNALAGFTNVKFNYNVSSNTTGSDFLPYGNVDDIGYCFNRSKGGHEITFKADIFSTRVLCTENIVDGSLGVEGGCENTTIANNICDRVFFGYGTVTTAAGANGEPFYPSLNGTITGNICSNVEVVGHESHTSNSGSPYDWVARPYDTAKRLIVQSNLCMNSTSEGLQLARLTDSLVSLNISYNAANNGMRVFKAENSIFSNNLSVDCGGTTDPSVLVDGDATNKTTNCDFINNKAINNTTIKTVAEVKFTQYVDDCFVDGFSIDPGATNTSALGLQYDSSTNIRVGAKTRFINEPSTSRFSIGASTTFKEGAMQFISDRLDLSVNDAYLLGLPDNAGRIGITEITEVYEKPHTAGTAATINIGSPSDTNRNSTKSSSVTGTAWEQLQHTILNSTSQPNSLIIADIASGTTDAKVRITIKYNEL